MSDGRLRKRVCKGVTRCTMNGKTCRPGTFMMATGLHGYAHAKKHDEFTILCLTLGRPLCR